MTVDGVTYQDGAMANNYHCPIALCDLEPHQIWSEGTKSDLLVSLGTGAKVFPSTKPQYRDKLHDGIIPRVFNYLTNGILNNQSVFHDYQCKQPEEKRERCHRFDIDVEKFKAMDDASSASQLRSQVRSCTNGLALRQKAIRGLLFSCFYFELHTLPSFDSGVYLCTGTIRIRNDPDAVLSTLFRHYPSSHLDFCVQEPREERRYERGEYGTKSLTIGSIEERYRKGSCRKCKRFGLPVKFRVRHTTDEKISIVLRVKTIEGIFEGKISGFPNSIEWFIRQQKLDDVFGKANHDMPSRGLCDHCPRGKRARGISTSREEKRART